MGDVVLIKEDTIRPEWPKGIITELIKSSDGKIRKAKVMNNKKHTLERAICDLHSRDKCRTSNPCIPGQQNENR